MALLASSTGIWVICNGLTAYTNPSTMVSFFVSLLYVAATIIVAGLFHFSIIFPYKIINFDRFHRYLIYLPVLIFSYIIFFTDEVVNNFSVAPDNPGYIQPGKLHALLIVVISIYFFSAITILYKKMLRADGNNKRNILLTISGVLLGGIPAIALNSWAVIYNIQINPLIAVIFSVFWVGTTSYILIKR